MLSCLEAPAHEVKQDMHSPLEVLTAPDSPPKLLLHCHTCTRCNKAAFSTVKKTAYDTDSSTLALLCCCMPFSYAHSTHGVLTVCIVGCLPAYLPAADC